MTDDVRLPVRLAVVPLFDATFELRFTPTKQGVAELLPGVISAQLGERYGRSVATPVASMPPEIRYTDPRLKNQIHYRITGDDALIFVGEEIAGVNQGPPYEGWSGLSPRIEEFIRVLKDSGLIETVDRFSMKFSNLFPHRQGNRLDQLNFEVSLADFVLTEPGMNFRVELSDEKFTRIIQIAPETVIGKPEKDTVEGLLLALDCIQTNPPDDFLLRPSEALEDLHVELKRMFFSIITVETLKELGPEYE